MTSRLTADPDILQPDGRICRPGQVAHDRRSFQQVQDEEKSAREAERVLSRAYLPSPAHAHNLHAYVRARLCGP